VKSPYQKLDGVGVALHFGGLALPSRCTHGQPLDLQRTEVSSSTGSLIVVASVGDPSRQFSDEFDEEFPVDSQEGNHGVLR